MTSLPLNHFYHLKRLADLRRCDVTEALGYLIQHIDPIDENWIDQRWTGVEGEFKIDLGGYDVALVIKKIQGLPRNLRPVTDGPYLKDFSFFTQDQGLLGIEAEGVKMLDFEMATSRDKDVFALVKDLLPEMTVQQYRVYNTFNSQYLRLVREPQLFTMPRIKAVAIDAGCYVGYKALAMAQFIDGSPVLAFELATDNLEVLKLNIANNPSFPIEAVRAALSDTVADLTIHTRNERTMAHSLTSFTQLKEANTSLLSSGQTAREMETVRTVLLDDYTRDVEQLSAVHISVNGHEPEVVLGGIETAKKADILRVSCPYSRDGRMVRDAVIEGFQGNGVEVFGTSGAAVIAGKELGDYHAIPIGRPTVLQRELMRAKAVLRSARDKLFPPRLGS
jgi:FkbM family methyltransferase